MKTLVRVTMELCKSKDPDARINAALLKCDGSVHMRYNLKTAREWINVVNTKLRRETIIALAKRCAERTWCSGLASGAVLAALRGDELKQVFSRTAAESTTVAAMYNASDYDLHSLNYCYIQAYDASGKNSVTIRVNDVIDGMTAEDYLSFMRSCNELVARKYFEGSSAHRLHETENLTLLDEGTIAPETVLFGYSVGFTPTGLLLAAVEKNPALNIASVFKRMSDTQVRIITETLLDSGYSLARIMR